ncbi:hypothetical protein ATO6_17475 [Oceanicola sp. 22II-s10i]|uniref:hypothetical protein n=1 Tax=Oceanicola sp. 22II-s10i TaxID=1317116 RepID=UPI000B523CEC|nr:hypothetical protein [Oceanicola sp. 22II-s10i]OWU83652.1 hypothetical protein ATO6_17475 [Oceanicola sp. 22II-s10i]
MAVLDRLSLRTLQDMRARLARTDGDMPDDGSVFLNRVRNDDGSETEVRADKMALIARLDAAIASKSSDMTETAR